MKELTTKNFSDLIYNKLKELIETVTLENSTTEVVFPCRKIGTPLETVEKTANAIPLIKKFQISISHWAEEQGLCMEMANKTDEKLRNYNMIRTSTTPVIFDDITKKYNLITNYEVHWEALTNSFIFTK